MPRKLNVIFPATEIKTLNQELESGLIDFFSNLSMEGAEKYFHPHPLTPDEARLRCSYTGADIYCVLIENEKIVGYAMMRGWDEGFETPSLGIAIRRSARGKGFACMLMKFLHSAARKRGARRIILKVHKDNLPAKRLYEKFGYKFAQADKEGQLIGYVDL